MKIIFIVFALIVSGCSVTKEYAATGGSKADGIIKLSYEVSKYQVPQVNEQQGLTLARKKCNGWGYSDAEALGGVQRACNEPTLTSCANWIVTKEYQCIGGQEKK